MKRWAVVTCGLYLVALVALSATFIGLFGNPSPWDMFAEDGFWLWMLLFAGVEALLLVVPVRIAEDRPKPRRGLLVPVITTALMFAVLVLLTVFCILFAILGDETFELCRWWSPLWALVALWVFWGVVFHRFARTSEPGGLMNRLMRWLLRGSIVELLVAVPCHIIVRQRNECCAPYGTLIGMAAGIAIMLLSFGPGVFYLFVERCRRLRP